MNFKIKCIKCYGAKPKPKKKKVKRTAAAAFANTKKGPRPDVHPTYNFKSRTEANFARILQYHKVDWKYEERAFSFTSCPHKPNGYKKGPYIYHMDFEIKTSKRLPDGLCSGWWEIKGFMTPQSRSKLRRLLRCYPEEAAKTTVVIYHSNKKKDIEFCQKLGYRYIFYNELTEKYESLIDRWE